MAGKPGRPRSLTLEQIAQAALDDGLADFSMPSVARRVGVAHSALYRYVTDREDLLYHATELSLSDFDWPSPDQPWEDIVRVLGDSVWALTDRFPGFERAQMISRRPSPTWLEHCALYVDSLVNQGFTREDASVVIDFVIRHALVTAHELGRYGSEVEHLAQIPAALKAFGAMSRVEGRGWYDKQVEILLAGAATLRNA